MDLAELQILMEDTFGAQDRQRGLPASMAWLASVANQIGVSMDEAAARYSAGCPKCGGRPCACPGV